MKKIFTLLTFLTCVAAAFAADNYVFVDKQGNTIPAGTTITCSTAEVDDFGGVIVHSGLLLKNVDAPSNYQVTVDAKITRIDNGAVQLCFPTNCFSYSSVGTHGSGQKGTISQGQSKNIQTEWLPVAYGECIVEYTATYYQSVFKKGDYTITVHYKYADPTAIHTAAGAARVQPVQCYDMQGRQQSAAQRGLSVVRMSDGSVRKVFSSK